MKILYVITGLGLGGAEKVVCDLADQMVNKGHIVKIAYLTGDAVVKPSSNDIEIIYLGLNNFKSLIKASVKYQKLLNTFHPDVVHAHMVHANIFTRLNRIGTNVPKLISTAHSNNEGGQLRMKAYRATNFLADITTNVSNNACKEFIKKKAVPQSNIQTMYNGINLERFKIDNLKLENKNIDFIAIGRLHEAKDYPNLIEALKIFHYKNADNKITLKIVGKRDETIFPRMDKLVKESNLEKVEFLGVREDIPDLLNNSKFFISSSKYEGLPTVVIEAMACGCFVIATDCGGTAEIMGDTGILVPPQDSQALAQAMLKALNLTNEQIEANNKRARKRIEELFSLEKSVEKWLEIYTASDREFLDLI